MDREARRAAVHEVAKNWTELSDWTELMHKVLKMWNTVIVKWNNQENIKSSS